ncbi:hypothetical protein BH11BAC2_BH11BAC2_09240 [soil metagenome]
MRKILLLIMLIVIAGVLLYQRFDKREARKINIIVITADQIFSEFEGDEIAATKKFGNQELVVTGIVKSVNNEQDEGRSVTLQVHSQKFGVICRLDKSIGTGTSFTDGEEVKLRGICKGMMIDVVLINCVPETE